MHMYNKVALYKNDLYNELLQFLDFSTVDQ